MSKSSTSFSLFTNYSVIFKWTLNAGYKGAEICVFPKKCKRDYVRVLLQVILNSHCILSKSICGTYLLHFYFIYLLISMRKTTNSLFKFQTSSSLKIYDPTGTRKSSSFRRKKQDTKFIFLNIDFPYTFLNVNFIDPASFHRN